MDENSRKVIQKYKALLSHQIPLESIIMWVRKFNLFTNSMLRDINDPSCELDFYDELCTRGPQAFLSFIIILKKSDYNHLAKLLEDDVAVKMSTPFYYKMDSKPVGYCLIIINEIFDNSKKNRMGSNVDAYTLEDLFKKLQYHVTVKWNKTGGEILSILSEFSQKPEFKDVDSCVVYILTHGGRILKRDFLYGTDDEMVYLEDIYNKFNNENSPALICKPKIFFFQACRGALEDGGVKIRVEAGNENISEGQELEIETSTDASGFSSFTSIKILNDWYPTISDMIIVHSTLPNYKSRKNHITGSWLCEDFVTVVKNNFCELDLLTMLTFVSRRMQERVSVDNTKQTIHIELYGVTGIVHFNRMNMSIEN